MRDALEQTAPLLLRPEVGKVSRVPVRIPLLRSVPLRMNKLSLKIALAVVAFALATVLLGWGFSFRISLIAALVWVLALGVFTYAVVYRLLVPRMELARGVLRQIRQRKFEDLEAAHLPSGDEMNALIWQVYRTGLSVETELSEMRRMESYRREFLGNVSHELKTPIFTIQGFTETLLDGAMKDERVNRAFLEKILRNTNRLRILASDLSEISRLETGEFKLNPEPFNLRQVAREVTESLELTAAGKNITLRLDIAENLPSIVGDRERIRQVLVNLVENAIKYNDPGGWVAVSLTLDSPSEVRIAVSDNGIGIAPQDIPRLTERFYRVDKSRSRDQGGTGLGLAIVKHILSAHNRSLLIESRLGQGSTFAFTMPVA